MERKERIKGTPGARWFAVVSSNSRPIAVAVNLLIRHCANPFRVDMVAAKRVLRYLQGNSYVRSPFISARLVRLWSDFWMPIGQEMFSIGSLLLELCCRLLVQLYFGRLENEQV